MLVIEDKDLIKDTLSFTKEVSQYDWSSFLKIIILIILFTLIVFLGFLIYYFFILKRKEKEKKENNSNENSNNLSILLNNLIEEIQSVFKIIEKIIDNQNLLINKVLCKISAERLKVIYKRYVVGFLYFCLDCKSFQEIEKEFDRMLIDIGKETIDCNIFINNIRYVDFLDKLSEEYKRNGIKQNFYKFEKELVNLLDKAIQNTIKEYNNLNYLINLDDL